MNGSGLFRGTSAEIASLNVGDELFNFDGNRREYRRGENGIRSGAPIYEKHFRADRIEGETSKSWIVGPHKARVNKKTLESACHYADRGYFTKSAMDADIWTQNNRHEIVRLVERAGPDHLKEIARILGYREAKAAKGEEK